MMNTTIVLAMCMKLIERFVRRFRSTKKNSYLVNGKLGLIKKTAGETGSERRMTIRLRKRLPPEEIEKLIEEGWKNMIKWK